MKTVGIFEIPRNWNYNLQRINSLFFVGTSARNLSRINSKIVIVSLSIELWMLIIAIRDVLFEYKSNRIESNEIEKLN